MNVEGYGGHDWGEQLSFTVGTSYVCGNQKKSLKIS